MSDIVSCLALPCVMYECLESLYTYMYVSLCVYLYVYIYLYLINLAHHLEQLLYKYIHDFVSCMNVLNVSTLFPVCINIVIYIYLYNQIHSRTRTSMHKYISVHPKCTYIDKYQPLKVYIYGQNTNTQSYPHIAVNICIHIYL